MAALQYFRRQGRKEQWLVLGLGAEILTQQASFNN